MAELPLRVNPGRARIRVVEPLAIHHVSVNVSNVDKSVAFYTGILGGTLRYDRPDLGIGGVWMNVGSQQVHLIEAPAPPNLGQHFAIRVDDLDSVVKELRSKGLDVTDPAGIGASWQAFVNDPDGNVVELHQVGGSLSSV